MVTALQQHLRHHRHNTERFPLQANSASASDLPAPQGERFFATAGKVGVTNRRTWTRLPESLERWLTQDSTVLSAGGSLLEENSRLVAFGWKRSTEREHPAETAVRTRGSAFVPGI
jgi:hypothetical protein